MYSTPDHVNFTKSQTVGSVINSKQDIHCLIEIPITATIEEAFDLLLAENILSVPVYRFWRGHKQPIAIVNVLDLVTFIQPMFDKEDDSKS
ncbi:10440_t:CDS:2, partial [Acaulospora morrowiae]